MKSSRILRFLASLRLTVALLVAALVLVFVGTLAQNRLGVWEAVATYFRAPIAWVDPALLLPGSGLSSSVRLPIPGGLLISFLMVVNLLAAHTVRFRFTAARAGIVALHAGLIVLFVGEFVTGFFSHEGVMRIDVGKSASFVEDTRSVELAIIDTRNPKFDTVVSIPGSEVIKAATSGSQIEHASLPFQVTVENWEPNSRLIKARGPNRADRGVGLEAMMEPVTKVAGADGGASDAPAAYVTLHADGKPLGSWLVSADLLDAQEVKVGGDTFGIALRFSRTYKPYTLSLLEFRHDKFSGTEIARNFSSRVRLTDAAHGTDREVSIWMNNPLRYRGATFYQASFKPDGSGTVLQVVENPGAALPYVASAMVAGGMVWHFLWVLTGYLKRRKKSPAAVRESVTAAGPESLKSRALRILPMPLIGAVGILIATSGLLSPRITQGKFNVEGFSLIPVSAGGRMKPMDTAARNLVGAASGRQEVKGPDGKIPAVRFLLDLIAKPEDIRELPILRVDHPGVLALMGLKPEQAGRLSLELIDKHWEAIGAQAQVAADIERRERDAFQVAVLDLHSRVMELLDYAALRQPYGIPPIGPEGEWAPFAAKFGEPMEEMQVHPAVAYQTSIFTAWNEGDPDRFNKAVETYLRLLERDMPSVMQRCRLEVLFNRAGLFRGAMTVYVMGFLALCVSLLLGRRRDQQQRKWDSGEFMRRAGTTLVWSAFVVHSVALLTRIYLQDRPPVTNLYSSAIFVGWGAVFLGLLLERMHQLGVAALGSTIMGFTGLVVAHNLGTDGDTMQMMQAVLDSNFWLATHVVTITLGYSATFFAGTLAALCLIMMARSREGMRPETLQSFYRMVYGTVCFALLLSFVGTVLGGIWADQSWGRFWGWDPKENGAALVVIINAIIIHARWGGIIRERGVMILAVFGNIVTAWSWFGTNMLGVGLHSYGFMSSAVTWLLIFVASQIAIMLLGLRTWRGGRARVS